MVGTTARKQTRLAGGLDQTTDTVGKLSRKTYSKPGKHGLLKAATRNLIFFLIRTPKGGLPTFTH